MEENFNAEKRKTRNKIQENTIPLERKTKNKIQENISPTETNDKKQNPIPKTKKQIQEDKFNDLSIRVSKLEEMQNSKCTKTEKTKPIKTKNSVNLIQKEPENIKTQKQTKNKATQQNNIQETRQRDNKIETRGRKKTKNI